MTGQPDLSEQDLKHLELLQSVISRLSNNSFLVKGWCITLNSVLIAVAHGRPNWRTIPVVVTVVIGFWLLDGYYLRQERMFRSLYEKVVAGGQDPRPGSRWTPTATAPKHPGCPCCCPGRCCSATGCSPPPPVC